MYLPAVPVEGLLPGVKRLLPAMDLDLPLQTVHDLAQRKLAHLRILSRMMRLRLFGTSIVHVMLRDPTNLIPNQPRHPPLGSFCCKPTQVRSKPRRICEEFPVKAGKMLRIWMRDRKISIIPGCWPSAGSEVCDLWRGIGSNSRPDRCLRRRACNRFPAAKRRRRPAQRSRAAAGSASASEAARIASSPASGMWCRAPLSKTLSIAQK